MKKGRNAALVDLRNQALIARFYYWSILCERRFDRVLETLSKHEFFISESTIMILIVKNDEYIQKLISEKVSIEKLALAFPEWNWKPNLRFGSAKEQLKLFED